MKDYFNQIRIMDADQLASLPIKASEAIDAIEMILRSSNNGKALKTPKSVLLPPDGKYIMSTLSSAFEPPFMAVKALILDPTNSSRGLPEINAVVNLFDSKTGLPVALIEGNWVTAIRTAAISGAAARKLANPDSSTIAFIGCGVQARSHLSLFSEMFPLSHVRIFGRGIENQQKLASLAEEMNLTASMHPSANDTIAEADIIVSSVSLTQRMLPFVDARFMKPGAFASVTDLAIVWIPESFESLDRIVIDDLTQEAGHEDKLVRPDLVNGDLFELVTDKIEGRQSPDEKTAFVFRGIGLGDLAIAALAYQKLQE